MAAYLVGAIFITSQFSQVYPQHIHVSTKLVKLRAIESLCRVARKPDRRKLIHISFICDPVTYFTLSVVLQSTILGKSLLGCTLLCGILLRESLPARSTLTFASVAAILHTALIHAAEH